MPIPAGRFNRQIEIWRKVDGAKNALGEKQTGYALFIKRRAGKDWLTREEKLAAAQDDATQTAKFTVRFCSQTATITTADRLRYGGVDYNIKSIQEYGFREAFDIYVEGTVA